MTNIVAMTLAAAVAVSPVAANVNNYNETEAVVVVDECEGYVADWDEEENDDVTYEYYYDEELGEWIVTVTYNDGWICGGYISVEE